jgi:hypothetical protein
LVYAFLQFQRLKQKCCSVSIAQVRNALIADVEAFIAKKFNLPFAA